MSSLKGYDSTFAWVPVSLLNIIQAWPLAIQSRKEYEINQILMVEQQDLFWAFAKV